MGALCSHLQIRSGSFGDQNKQVSLYMNELYIDNGKITLPDLREVREVTAGMSALHGLCLVVSSQENSSKQDLLPPCRSLER